MDEEHENCSGEECRICEGYEIFQELMSDGIQESEAFRDVITMILEEFAEELSSVMEEHSMAEGYTLAMRDMAENATEAANRMEKLLNMEDDESSEAEESDDGLYEKKIFVEGDLSEEEIADIVNRIDELGEDDDIEVVSVECGVDCGCVPDECLFEDGDEAEFSFEVDIDSVRNSPEDDSATLGDGFLYGQDFVKWIEDKL